SCLNRPAASVWLLAVLGPGLSLSAEDNSEHGFTLCSDCFYRQTPPRGASAGPLLRPLCHRLHGGQAFATLSKPTCDTAVYSAFHLTHGWTEGEGEGGELLTEEEDNIKVAAPSLLRGDGDPSHHVSPTDSPLQRWDSTVTTLVQSSISPQCSTLGGDLYILTGQGGLGAAEDGDEECQRKPLWSAVCCAVPEGKGSFSVGLITETEEGGRQVSMKELEEMLGVAEMFPEGCGGADAETVGVVVGFHSEGIPENIEGMDAEASGETSADAVKSASSIEDLDTGADIFESSGDHETVDEQETDTNSTSTLVYILSTALSILKAPLCPVFSTATQLPGQVTYVLQEDLGVLSALPGDTFSLLHLLTSDLLSWIGSAGELLLGVGETGFHSTYYCTSSMLGALWSHCHTGVTGVGTLAGDTVGVFGDALDNAWWVTKFFGGRLWEQSEGYVETMVSEMGAQAKAVGGGLGRLVWRSVSGVCNVFWMVGGFIIGIVDVFIGGISGQSSIYCAASPVMQPPI
uniref:INO80 complex subunit E n=1 Tax=Scophthalmus maximus TaxID=52904 RepID=A0A8D3AC04_SCOMX